MLPGLLVLSIATAAGAITVLLSGWTGQLRTSFIAVTVIVVLSVTVQEIVPFAVRRLTPRDQQTLEDRPYLATRVDFTRGAYEPNAAAYEAQRKAGAAGVDDSVVTNPASQELLRRDSLSYPGAHGLALVSDPQLDVAGQPLGDGFSRLGYAWAYQNFNLLADSVPRRARMVAVRDVRSRVRALAPIFAQGTVVEPMFHADTLYWKLELYSASATFPLSKHFMIAGEERSYFRHAATALVNARTARVFIAADAVPDPVSAAWMARFPNAADYRAPGIAKELTSTPWSPAPDAGVVVGDSTFRASVTQIYNRMRAALAEGDLKSFGSAFDSLGALIGRHQR
jgi:uncharacterized membrane protein (UPF0182 family)